MWKKRLFATVMSVALLAQLCGAPVAAQGIPAGEESGGDISYTMEGDGSENNTAGYEEQIPGSEGSGDGSEEGDEGTGGKEGGEGAGNEDGENPGGEDAGDGGSGDDGSGTDEDGDDEDGEDDAGGEDGDETLEDPESTGGVQGAGGAVADFAPTPRMNQDISYLYEQYLSGLPQSEWSILDPDWVLAFTDANGNPTDQPVADGGVHMEFPFTIPNEIVSHIEQGDYYEFHLPDAMKLSAGESYPLEFDGVEYATVTISPDGTVRITFDETIRDLNDVTGSIVIDGGFDEDSLGSAGDHFVTVPDVDKLPGKEIVIKPSGGSSIAKKGQFDKAQNPDNITWTVDINTGLDILTDPEVRENFPPEVEYLSTTVYSIKVDFDGKPIAGSEVALEAGIDYTVDADGNVQFTNGETQQAYRIVHNTHIKEEYKQQADGNGARVTFENEAILSAPELTGDLPANASLTTTYGKKLAKTVGNYDPVNQIFTWNIQYNYNEGTVLPGNSVLEDVGPGMEFLPDSVVVRHVTFDANGNPVLGEVLEPGSDYTLVQTSDGFQVVFSDGLNYAVNISYQTHVTDIIDDANSYGNVVTDGDGHTTGGSGSAEQVGLVKRVVDVDYEQEIIYWQVDVNRAHYTMRNWRMEDTITPGPTAQQYTGQFQMVDLGGPDGTGGKGVMELGTDYSLLYAGDGASFNLAFLTPYLETNHSFRITYSTAYDPQQIPAGDRFTNRVEADWEDTSDIPHHNEDDAGVRPTRPEQDNGGKSGSYNAQTKEITWSIIVNYDLSGLKNAYFEDPMLGDQTYVHDSMRIYHYTVEPDGTLVQGAELTAAEYSTFYVTEPSEDNGNTLTVQIPDGNGQYLFQFRTSVEDTIVAATYDNVAHFHNDLTRDNDLSASVSVENGDRLVGKEGTRDPDGYVWWTIVVNPSQSTIEDVVVSDVPSANQLIDMDSLVVYGSNVAVNGDVSIDYDTVLTEGVDYTASYEQNSEGLFELTVSFQYEINRPYVIRYRVRVIVAPGVPSVTLTNDVTVTGSHEELVNDGGQGNITVNVSSGGGFIQGTTGSLTLRKMGSGRTQALAGAVFQLYDDERRAVGGLVTTDASGYIYYSNLVYGTYYLVELEAPAGYYISDGLRTGLPVTVNASTSAGNIVVVDNPSADVQLTKTSSLTGGGLPGAEFILEQSLDNGLTWTRIRAGQSLVTNAQGVLLIQALTDGLYRLTEITAPAGYILDPRPHEFTIAPQTGPAGNLYYVTQQVPFQNEPTSVLLLKEDPDGTRLAGAVFILEAQDAVTGEWTRIRLDENFATNANGELRIQGLPFGTYRLLEVSQPDGYALETRPFEFTLSPDDFDVENGELEIQLPIYYNYPTLVIMYKTSSEDENLLLPGAVFALEQFTGGGSDGWERIRADERFFTNDLGVLFIGRLDVNSDYRLREIEAPPGYSINPETIPFDLVTNPDGSVDPIVIGPFVNTPSEVTLTKVGDGGAPLAGAEFRLEQLQDGVWQPIREDERFVTDADGMLRVVALPVGRYRFVETSAPDGYQLATQPVEFAIVADADGVIAPVVLGPVENLLNEAVLYKVDTGENPLAGAVFRLDRLQADGTWAVVEGSEALVTGTDGRIVLTGLPAGSYRLAETAAPEGYLLAGEAVEFLLERNLTGTFAIGSLVNYMPGQVALPPQSGDGARTGALLLLAAAAGVCLLVLVINKRRRKQ